MPYITLRCASCDNVDCPMAREYIPGGSKEGCTRELDETDVENFHHQMREVLPFLSRRRRTRSTDAAFQEIDAMLRKTYQAPLGSQLNSHGKVDFRFSANRD